MKENLEEMAKLIKRKVEGVGFIFVNLSFEKGKFVQGTGQEIIRNYKVLRRNYSQKCFYTEDIENAEEDCYKVLSDLVFPLQIKKMRFGGVKITHNN